MKESAGKGMLIYLKKHQSDVAKGQTEMLVRSEERQHQVDHGSPVLWVRVPKSRLWERV